MRFTHIDINFDVKYEGHQNCSKTLSMHKFKGFWSPSYVTSKLMSICVNLIMWIYFFLWTSSIVHVFDFLTFDIFLTTWHFLTYDIWAIGHMGNGTHGQRGIMVNIKDRDVVPWGWGTWVMGHVANWAWAIGHMIITSLILHGSLPKFYWT